MKTFKHSFFASALSVLALASIMSGCSSPGEPYSVSSGTPIHWVLLECNPSTSANSSKVITETKPDTMTAMRINELQKMAK